MAAVSILWCKPPRPVGYGCAPVVHAEQTMSQVVGTIPVVPTGRTDLTETPGVGDESSPTGAVYFKRTIRLMAMIAVDGAVPSGAGECVERASGVVRRDPARR
jgi:hypothetical protein